MSVVVVVVVVDDGVRPVADLWRSRGGRRCRRLELPLRTGAARLGVGLSQPLRLPELGAAILKPDLCENGTCMYSKLTGVGIRWVVGSPIPNTYSTCKSKM